LYNLFFDSYFLQADETKRIFIILSLKIPEICGAAQKLTGSATNCPHRCGILHVRDKLPEGESSSSQEVSQAEIEDYADLFEKRARNSLLSSAPEFLSDQAGLTIKRKNNPVLTLPVCYGSGRFFPVSISRFIKHRYHSLLGP
jgi:hypothetical protein